MNDYLKMTDKDIICNVPINLETIKLVEEIGKMSKAYEGEDILDIIYSLIIEKHDQLTSKANQ